MTTSNTNTENFASDLEEANYGIIESMNKEQFEQHFRENREITFKNLTVGIMDWGDGRFDVLSPEDNKQGYTTLNPNPYTSACETIMFVVDHLLAYDVNRNADGTQVTSSTSPAKKRSSKPKEPKYNGPRTIKVFGREIYIEENTKATFDDIRVNLVTEYNFPNFKKDKVFFDFDESTGTLEVLLKFQTKG